MAERKSPTAILHEGPRALSGERVREIEESSLAGVARVDIDDVIEYVHKDLRSLPDFTTLYRKYLKQRWDVRSSGRSGCLPTRRTRCAAIRTTNERGCGTARTTSCGSRACSRCR